MMKSSPNIYGQGPDGRAGPEEIAQGPDSGFCRRGHGLKRLKENGRYDQIVADGLTGKYSKTK